MLYRRGPIYLQHPDEPDPLPERGGWKQPAKTRGEIDAHRGGLAQEALIPCVLI
jgi:hypothetical protein